jgi:para-nitrobenzyl esterase
MKRRLRAFRVLAGMMALMFAKARFWEGRRRLCYIFTGIFAAFIFWSRSAFAAAPIIVTDQGPLGGFAVSGENEYLGIPYASPPVGSLRWLPPQAPSHFKGIFQATQFGNACAQPKAMGLIRSGGAFGSEDCLTLNVYVPNVMQPAHGFPVMVWVHGGGLVFGAGSFYDPTPLVK